MEQLFNLNRTNQIEWRLKVYTNSQTMFRKESSCVTRCVCRLNIKTNCGIQMQIYPYAELYYDTFSITKQARILEAIYVAYKWSIKCVHMRCAYCIHVEIAYLWMKRVIFIWGRGQACRLCQNLCPIWLFCRLHRNQKNVY